jgi:hypothetical protein
MNFIRSILFCAAAALASAGTSAIASVEIGQSAPDFSLTDIDGHTRRLSDF